MWGTGTFAGNLSTNIRLVFLGLQENADLFKADTSSQIWQDYIEYINGIVLDGFYRLIHKSLELLLTNMVPDVRPGLPCGSTCVLCVCSGCAPARLSFLWVFCSAVNAPTPGLPGQQTPAVPVTPLRPCHGGNRGARGGMGMGTAATQGADLFQDNVAPLFEVHMDLCDSRVGYRPSLEMLDDNSFLELVETLLSDIYGSTECMPRLLEGKLSYKVGPWPVSKDAAVAPGRSPGALPVPADRAGGAGGAQQDAGGGGVAGGQRHEGRQGVQCQL